MTAVLPAFRRHWPEYPMETAGLGLFMFSARLRATLLEHPGSPVRRANADPFLRRLPMGPAMGLTAVAIIYSPWGKHSGAHLNPAVTLSFHRLRKAEAWDAAFYAAAQFAGGSRGRWRACFCSEGRSPTQGSTTPSPFPGSPVRRSPSEPRS